MEIKIPAFCLVALIGTSGSGKSTFAKKHFLPTEVISSDQCRAVVSDDETDQASTDDAFDILHYIANKRLSRGKLTVVDATNVQPESRKSIVRLAKDNDCFAVAIVLNLSERVCQDRNARRENRDFGPHVIRRQRQILRKNLSGLKREGFRYVFVLDDQETIDNVTIERTKLWTNLQEEHGPFDIIGDIHGCYDELVELLEKLDYQVGYEADGFLGGSTKSETSIMPGKVSEELAREMSVAVVPPPGRKLVFLGDLVDRGPKSPQVLNLVMRMVSEDNAICVPGNHDVKLMKKLQGRNVKVNYGLAETLEQLEEHSIEFKEKIAKFISRLVSHYVLDDGKIVVSHAGMKAKYQGRSSGRVREFALYGDTTGETDEFGLPVRYEWANDYRGEAMVVYGHTPVAEAVWVNRTMNIDTGCVFGGELTCLRYPERELVSVEAHKEYYESVKPFKILESKGELVAGKNARQQLDDRPEADLLRIEDVIGKRRINTKYRSAITIKEENAIAALESISRFAVDPHWLVYLPPTMSPSETCGFEDYLERPEEALRYYSSRGVDEVVCQEKHMGSRAVVIVCKNAEAAARKFGSVNDTIGICYTRTGRRFFSDSKLEAEFLASVKEALDTSGFWKKFDTEWVALDCELMPWSQKAQELLKDQYARTGAAARGSLGKALDVVNKAKARGVDVEQLDERLSSRIELTEKYISAYRQYCWKVESLKDLKLAPFHILATEGACHSDKDHSWHMHEIKQFCGDSELLMKTNYLPLDLKLDSHVSKAVSWWESLTSKGGEGMVVKPLQFISKHKGNIIQPAIKCRGKEYLRIIYGPEYTLDKNIERLRKRGLSSKRSLALREFALGLESLELFVKGEPLYKIHECVFGILALESEPVDPRL